MRTIKLTEESQTIKIGEVTITTYINDGKTVINVFAQTPVFIEPLGIKSFTIKAPLK